MMPGKPVAARGKRFSPAELEAARRVRLADVIADDLVVLFCGANPGLSSAAARAPFATPSDRWWPALYESGFTPRRLAPQEAHELLALGLGLTSLVRRPTVGVAELARAEFVEGGRLLRRRVVARRPRWLAVLGVTAYRAAFGRPDAAVGLQEDTIGSTRLWILPNPSGLNAHYPPRALATEFARLRVAAGLPDRSRRPEDATLCRAGTAGGSAPRRLRPGHRRPGHRPGRLARHPPATEDNIAKARREYDRITEVRHRTERHSLLRPRTRRMESVEYRPQARRHPRRLALGRHQAPSRRRGLQPLSATSRTRLYTANGKWRSCGNASNSTGAF